MAAASLASPLSIAQSSMVPSTGERVVIETTSDKVTQSDSRDAMPKPAINDAVAFEIGSVPEVEAVYVQHDFANNVFYVWSVVPERDHELYERIYAKEKEIIGRFEQHEFDFNIVPSRGGDARTLICEDSVQLAYARTR